MDSLLELFDLLCQRLVGPSQFVNGLILLKRLRHQLINLMLLHLQLLLVIDYDGLVLALPANELLLLLPGDGKIQIESWNLSHSSFNV